MTNDGEYAYSLICETRTEARRIKDKHNSDTVGSDESISGPTAREFALRFLHFASVSEGTVQHTTVSA